MSEQKEAVFDTATVSGIVSHMNEDHKDALILYLKVFSGAKPDSFDSVEMLDIDAFGITLGFSCNNELRKTRILFQEAVGLTALQDVSQSRAVLVDMVKKAREIDGEH